jgi:GH43 family beta-xylosidase
MKKITSLFVKRLFALMIMCCFYSGMAQSFTNPIADIADPQISYIDGYYYVTGTFDQEIRLRRATTIEGLKSIESTRVFGDGGVGLPNRNFWEAEMHQLDGKFYIYFTAKIDNMNVDDVTTHVIECSDANPVTGAWTYKGRLFDPNADFRANSPTIAEINGNRYFFYAGRDGVSNENNIYVSAMSNPWTLSGARTQIYTSRELENIPDGAPTNVLVRGGKAFLTYSVSGCGGSDSRIGLMYMNNVADNPLLLSSWTKEPTPVFDDTPSANSYNPIQIGFFKSPDGTEDWISYSSTHNNNSNCGDQRSSKAQKISFDANGMLVLGVPATIGKVVNAPSGEVALPVGTVVTNGLYKIQPISQIGGENRYMEIAGAPGELQGGANVGIYFDNNDEPDYKWYLQATGVTPDEYTIVSFWSGLLAEVGGCNNNDGANVNMWFPNGRPCGLWILSETATGSGEYRFMNKNSGKYLAADSGNIYQGNLDESSNFQKFKLTFLEATLNVSIPDNNSTVVSLYPNPVQDHFIINGMDNSKTNNIIVTDMLGKTVKSVNTKSYDCNIDVNGLKPGLYIVSITSEGKKIATRKILVK